MARTKMSFKIHQSMDEASDTVLEDTFNSSSSRVLPRLYRNGGLYNYENLNLFGYGKKPYSADGQLLDDIDPFYPVQKFTITNEINSTPIRNQIVKFSETPTQYLKKQINDIVDSSPSKFLQNYLDGSNELITAFPLSSSVSSSRDPIKQQLESPTSQILKSTLGPPISWPLSKLNQNRAKGLTKICNFRQSSSTIEDSSIVSSSSQNGENYGGEPRFNTIKSIIQVDSDDPYLFKHLKQENDDQIIRNPQRKKSSKRKLAAIEAHPPLKKKKKLSKKLKPPSSSPIKGSSANRPKRRVGRPRTYRDKISDDDEEDDDFHSPPSSSSDSSLKKNKRLRIDKYPGSDKSSNSFSRVSTSRSKSGCWTCRLRRKKCPEQKPECTECTRLGLHCDNADSPRPIYMNEKKAAKKKMDEIKEITNMKKKVRMRNRALKIKQDKEDDY